jgi:hypothetical protein
MLREIARLSIIHAYGYRRPAAPSPSEYASRLQAGMNTLYLVAAQPE